MRELISPSAEFAEFIADVSDPGTGMIRSDRLARWLGVEEECLIGSWHASGCSEWKAFAGQILEILDAFQDVSRSLSRSLEWYRELPLAECNGRPAAEDVARGNIGPVLATAQKMRRAAFKRHAGRQSGAN